MTYDLTLKRKRYKKLRATLRGKAKEDWRSIEQAYLTSTSPNESLTPDSWLLELEIFVENHLRNNFYKTLDAWVGYKEYKHSLSFHGTAPAHNSLFSKDLYRDQLKRDFLHQLDFNFWPMDRIQYGC